MITVYFQDGPMRGKTIKVPFAGPSITVRLGRGQLEYQRNGSHDGRQRPIYTAVELVERTGTTRRIPKQVPAATFNEDRDEVLLTLVKEDKQPVRVVPMPEFRCG